MIYFKIVQNKLHYAPHGYTAPEIIYERVDSDKQFIGLTTFSSELPIMSDNKINDKTKNEWSVSYRHTLFLYVN